MKDGDLRKNASGCSDPTAYEAIKNVNKEEEKFHKLLRAIFDVVELAGFKIENRIVLINKFSGRVWK